MTVRNNHVTAAAQSARVNHPTGLAVTISGVVGAVLLRLGVELTPEEALLLPVVVGLVVSALTPRFRTLARLQTADNVPSNGGTGPDPEDA
jgi:hypothetical protein